jgi:ABC-type amino acid transport substrate-binding protein
MSSSILPDTVVAAMDPTFRPFSFKTADGTIAGFDVDYLSNLAGRTVSVLSDTIK